MAASNHGAFVLRGTKYIRAVLSLVLMLQLCAAPSLVPVANPPPRELFQARLDEVQADLRSLQTGWPGYATAMALSGYILGPLALGLGIGNLTGSGSAFIAQPPAIGMIVLHFVLIAIGIGGTISGSTTAGRTNRLRRSLIQERDYYQRMLRLLPPAAEQPVGVPLGTF